MPNKRMKLIPVKADDETIRRVKAQARRKRISVSAYVRGLILAELAKRSRRAA